MLIHEILNKLRSDNGANFKMQVLRDNSNSFMLQTVLKMAYDKVTYSYGITMKNVPDDITIVSNGADMDMGLELLRRFASREFTGNLAQGKLNILLANMHPEHGAIIAGILNRDLRINMGRSNINKVFKDLIVKPVYMRCGVYSEDKTVNGKLKKGTCHKINPKGSYIQLKADGTYREFTVDGGQVSCNSRSGEEYEYPVIFDQLQNFKDGKYIGELLVRGVPNRAEANGMINSSEPPHKDIMLQLWDYVTLAEYANAANKVPNKTPYDVRFRNLSDIWVSHRCPNVGLIPFKIVNSLKEALQHTAKWMKEGFEGAIWKDKDAVFRDGTSLEQLKLKLEIILSMRVTGYLPGNKGSKNQDYFSAITFENADRTIRGQVGVTTMTEKQRNWFDHNRPKVIGAIMDVQCNDLSKARDHDYYALSHPRFDEMRGDITDTDTLERALELRDLAMMLDK